MNNSSNNVLQFGTYFWIAACGFLGLRYCDLFWSSSADLANHYVLVARLAEHWRLPADLGLGAMQSYPRYAHVAAAAAGVILGSPLAGMQAVTLVSLLLLWSAIAHAFLSLPNRPLFGISLALTVFFIANRLWIGLEVYGHEVIANFFFAQLAAQAVVMALIATALWLEQRRSPASARYLLLAAASPLIAGIHLLPALELLATLGCLVIVDSWRARGASRAESVTGLVAFGVSLVITILRPVFKASVAISRNDGALEFAYTPGVGGMLVLAALVLASSLLLVVLWHRFQADERAAGQVLLKYLAVFGMAIVALFGAQFLALLLGHGSLYACKKYLFGMNTLLVLQLPCLLIAATRPQWFRSKDAAAGVPEALRQSFVAVFVLIALRSLLPDQGLDLSKLVAVERYAQDYERLFAVKQEGRFDYAIGLSGFPPTMDYLFSIGPLKAPRGSNPRGGGNSRDIMNARPPREPDKIGRILTSVGAPFWDVPHCRKHRGGGSLVIVDGECVIASFQTVCAGRIDLATAAPYATRGFSVPEPHGRWSDGAQASFTCDMPADHKPRTVHMSTIAFVPPGRTQRMFISINGGSRIEHTYSPSQDKRDISLQLPRGDYKAIEIQFFFPDAVSPHEAGVNADRRRLAVGIKSIEFR